MSDCPQIVCCPPNDADYSLQSYPLYSNEELTFFIPCPTGFSCALPGVTIIIPAGTIFYRPTTAAGNTPAAAAQAINTQGQQQAQNQAYPQLFPQPSGTFFNSQLVLSCAEGGEGVVGAYPFFTGPGEITIPAGVFSGATQELADAAALNAALTNLNAQGMCKWWNDELIVACPNDGLGGPINIPAHTYDSMISKADANQQAADAAQGQIDDHLICYWENTEVSIPCPDSALGGPVVVAAGTYASYESQPIAQAQAQAAAESQVGTTCYWDNEEQTVNCPDGETGGPFTVPAGTYQSFVSQADANAIALADAQAQAAAGCSACPDYPVQDLVWTIIPFSGATGSASGGTGAGEVANNTVSFEAHLQNSCNPYDITISLPYTIRAPGLAFPPGVIRFIDIYVDGVQEAQVILPYPPAGCDSAVGTLSVTHTIATDAYSTANGFHQIYIYAGQDIAGQPDTPSCKTQFTFSITPLTPP